MLKYIVNVSNNLEWEGTENKKKTRMNYSRNSVWTHVELNIDGVIYIPVYMYKT